MLHIVSIDDIETNNVVIEFDLEEYFDSIQEKYRFKSFTEPKIGLSYLEDVNNRTDILFLDLMMPEMDGFTLLGKLRANDSVHQPYVIVVSALNDDESKAKAKELGSDTYISKPFDISEIHKTLDNYINSYGSFNEGIDDNDTQDEFFDDDGFIDFDEFFDDEADSEQKTTIETLNATHNGYDASSFCKDLLNTLNKEGYQDILSDFNQVLEDIDELSELSGHNIKATIGHYNQILSKVSLLMGTLGTEFKDLGYSISTSKHFLGNVHNIDKPEKLDLIATFLVAFLDEIAKWIETVFIKRDAIDVCYINASFRYSLIQIEDLLKDEEEVA